METQIELDAYKAFLEQYAKDLNTQSVSANGVVSVGILMSVMFRYTKSIVRLYCQSFNDTLVTQLPYWNALRDFLNKGKEIRILCDIEAAKDAMSMHLLRMEKEKHPDRNSIAVKLITEKDRRKICDSVAEEYYKFGVFDNNRFVVEYNPEGPKTFASFNRPDACKFLIELFDAAFENSKEIIV